MTIHAQPLSSVLLALGYTWRHGAHRTDVLRADEVVFVGRACEVWDWLAATWWQRVGWAADPGCIEVVDSELAHA
jgi:hypothetical protein